MKGGVGVVGGNKKPLKNSRVAKTITYCIPADGWCLSSLQAMATFAKTPANTTILLPSMTLHDMEYLWLFWVSYPGSAPSPPPAHLESASWVGTEWESEKAFTLCKHCSAVISLKWYHHCFYHKNKSHQHTGYCEENYFHPKQTHYNDFLL